MHYKKNLSLGISSGLWKNIDHVNSTFEQALSEVALLGFEGVELYNMNSFLTEELKYQLTLRKLVIAGQNLDLFVAMNIYENMLSNFKVMIKNMKKLGTRYLLISKMNHAIFANDDTVTRERYCLEKYDWLRISHVLNELGRISLASGIWLCFQPNLCIGMKTIEDIRQLVEMTNDKYVKISLDTGNGLLLNNIISIIKDYNERIEYVRVHDIYLKKFILCKKDMVNLSQLAGECFAILGDGEMDFSKIFYALNDVGYSGWITIDMGEKIPAPGFFEYLLKAYHYMQALLKFKFIDNEID